MSTPNVKKSQYDEFKEAARALGCEESEVAFDAKLANIAKQKPAPEPKPEKK